MKMSVVRRLRRREVAFFRTGGDLGASGEGCGAEVAAFAVPTAAYGALGCGEDGVSYRAVCDLGSSYGGCGAEGLLLTGTTASYGALAKAAAREVLLKSQ